ncbi:MAG: helix-turn-helix domain-containing protein [Clostridiales bacterium]|nr:helix-turn-helix domain-containing protein [Clostridiales bacterium]
MKVSVAQRLKEIRKENGLTQEQFGNKLSVSQDTVSLWEKGVSSPSVETVIAIAEIFGLTADYILGLSEY